MPRPRTYSLFLEAGVYPVIARLPRRRRLRLLDDLHQIARYPEAGIDYTDTALRRVLIHEVNAS